MTKTGLLLSFESQRLTFQYAYSKMTFYTVIGVQKSRLKIKKLILLMAQLLFESIRVNLALKYS